MCIYTHYKVCINYEDCQTFLILMDFFPNFDFCVPYFWGITACRWHCCEYLLSWKQHFLLLSGHISFFSHSCIAEEMGNQSVQRCCVYFIATKSEAVRLSYAFSLRHTAFSGTVYGLCERVNWRQYIVYTTNFHDRSKLCLLMILEWFISLKI